MGVDVGVGSAVGLGAGGQSEPTGDGSVSLASPTVLVSRVTVPPAELTFARLVESPAVLPWPLVAK